MPTRLVMQKPEYVLQAFTNQNFIDPVAFKSIVTGITKHKAV
jgi:hypothetical protein